MYPDKEQLFLCTFTDLFLTFSIFRLKICGASCDTTIALIMLMKELKVSRFRMCIFAPLGFLFQVLIPVLFSVSCCTHTFDITESVPIRECCYWWAVCLLDLTVSPAIWFSTMTTRKRHGRSSQVSTKGFCFFFFL